MKLETLTISGMTDIHEMNGVKSATGILLKVQVAAGTNPTSTNLGVTADLSAIGGSPNQTLFDDGSNGDAMPRDNGFSFQTVVAPGTLTGSKNLPFTVTDSIGPAATGAIALTVTGVPLSLATHDIQGSGNTSPYANQFVRTEGIVTARRFNNGFFIQAPEAEADGDPNSSEGMFVFTGSEPPAAVAVGNRVRVTGTAAEFLADAGSLTATEITSPSVVVLATGQPLPSAITLTSESTNPAGGLGQLERFEGMRVHVAALTVVAPTQGSVNEAVASGSTNGVYYGVLPDVARPFRESGSRCPCRCRPARRAVSLASTAILKESVWTATATPRSVPTTPPK